MQNPGDVMLLLLLLLAATASVAAVETGAAVVACRRLLQFVAARSPWRTMGSEQLISGTMCRTHAAIGVKSQIL